MPAALAGFAAAGALGATSIGATVVIGTVTVAQIAGAVVSLAISSAMADRERDKADSLARSNYNASLRDATMILDNPIVPRAVIIGEARASGPVWPWFTYGDQRQYHIFGVILAGHECDSIRKYFFNEDELTLDVAGNVIAPQKYTNNRVADGNDTFAGGAAGLGLITVQIPGGTVDLFKQSLIPDETGLLPRPERITNFVQVGRNLTVNDDTTGFNVIATYNWYEVLPLFSIKVHLGAPGQVASPELIYGAAQSGNPSAWDATRVGTGICYATVTMNADFNTLGDIGVPTFRVLARGVKAVDRRVGGPPVWTQNPAVLSDWFLVDCPYSPKTLSSEIHDDNCNASANVCDELVAFSSTVTAARYQANGLLSCDEIPLANLRHLLDAMDGDALPISGKWQLIAGRFDIPTLTISEDTLNDDDIEIAPYTQKSDLFNMVTGRFYNPADLYQFVSYPDVTNAVYKAEDGDEDLPQPMDYVLINDKVRCQMISWQRLTRARNGQTIQLGTTFRGYDTSPLKNVNVSLPQVLGPATKVCSVRRRDFSAPGLTYTLQETGPEVWDWDYTKADAVVDIPNTTFPDAITVPVLTGLAVSSGSANLLRLPNGSSQSRILVTWSAVDNVNVTLGGSIRWQFRKITDTAWQSMPPAPGTDTGVYIFPVEDGQTYALRGQCIFGSGREGNWSETLVETVIGKSENPRPPSSVAATAAAVIFALSPDVDIDGYEVRYNSGSNENGSVATALHDGLVPGSPWPMPIRLYGVNTVLVRAVDDGGRTSEWVADTQDFGIPDAANIAHFIDYAGLGFPGEVTGASVVGGDLVADLDPSTDIYGAGSGADIYFRDGAPDIYGGDQYLALVYLASYTSPYGGGAIFWDVAAVGSRIVLEYRVDGSTIGDVYSDGDGDGDIYSGSVGIYGDEQNWQPWPGVLTPSLAGVGLQLRLTIDAGSVQGEVSVFEVRTEMPTISQTFGRVEIDAAGTTLLPADGLPALTFIQIEDVQVTPIASAGGAIAGRVKGSALPSGIPIELIDESAVTVDGPAFVRVSGF